MYLRHEELKFVTDTTSFADGHHDRLTLGERRVCAAGGVRQATRALTHHPKAHFMLALKPLISVTRCNVLERP